MMKKITIISMLLLVTIGITARAQADLRKKIQVTGMAERALLPDEIYLRITLKEYKNGNRIVEMDRLEQGLVKSLRKLDISTDMLTVDNIYGYNWDWRKKRPDDFLASKSFRLQVSDLKRINDLVEYLDPEGLNGIQIAEIKHSRENEIREELAKEALKKAREKAEALLSAIDEEVGGVIEVSTVRQEQSMPQARVMYDAAESKAYSSNVEFRNIDIKVEIYAVFEIK